MNGTEGGRDHPGHSCSRNPWWRTSPRVSLYSYFSRTKTTSGDGVSLYYSALYVGFIAPDILLLNNSSVQMAMTRSIPKLWWDSEEELRQKEVALIKVNCYALPSSLAPNTVTTG